MAEYLEAGISGESNDIPSIKSINHDLTLHHY